MSRLRLTMLCLVAGLAGCMEDKKNDPIPRSSLYDRLKGTEGIKGIVDETVKSGKSEMANNPSLKPLFEDEGKLKKALIDWIGQAAGGPHLYSTKEGHNGGDALEVADLRLLLPALSRTLEKNNAVGTEDRKQLLERLSPRRGRTVQ